MREELEELTLELMELIALELEKDLSPSEFRETKRCFFYVIDVFQRLRRDNMCIAEKKSVLKKLKAKKNSFYD